MFEFIKNVKDKIDKKNKQIIFLIAFFSVFVGILVWAIISSPETSDIDFVFPEKFIIIVLPDTQKYSEEYPDIFTLQTKWIRDNIDNKNIIFVSHLGDIVDNWDSEFQWKNAKQGMSILDNKVAYGISAGNHDMSNKRELDYFNQYFPFFEISNQNYPNGKSNNNYQLFSVANNDFIIFHLEYCPEADVLEWANSIFKKYPNKRAIITTHGYLSESAKRDVHTSAGKMGGCTAESNNTQYIWDNLIYKNKNIFLVLSGHVHSEAQRTDNNIFGMPVHQLLADYQSRENGGNGWLRVLEFFPSEDKIYVKTYSPYLNQYEIDEDSDFILDYDMTGE
ncbi:MAG: metallophosphoesterase [Candidatus Nealsonbacteria bacterium]